MAGLTNVEINNGECVMDAKEYLNIEQGTDAWKQIRSGKVTASMISNVLMKPETAGFRDYQAQLVAEILTGKPQGSDYTSVHMQFGSETEPLAAAATKGVPSRISSGIAPR